MKRLLFLLPLLFSCQSEDQQPINCNCYKQNQEIQLGEWTNTTAESPQLMPCEKDSEIVQVNLYQRYIWKCN